MQIRPAAQLSLARRKRLTEVKPRHRRLLLESLEDRRVLTLWSYLGDKFNDARQAYSATIEYLFGPSADDGVTTMMSSAYDAAVVTGPMVNQLTSNGSTVLNASQTYISQWKASEAAIAAQIPPTAMEEGFEKLGSFASSAFHEVLTSPSTQFAVGMAATCWVVNGIAFVAAPPAVVALTPWCIGLTKGAAISIGSDVIKEFGVDVVNEATTQVVESLDLPPVVETGIHRVVNTIGTGYDLYGLSKALNDVERFKNSPDIVKKLYYNVVATTEFLDWVDDLKPYQTSLFRANDSVTSSIIEAGMMGEGIRYQARSIGKAVLEITQQRSLTTGERQAVQSILMDGSFNTQFLGFTPQQSQQLIQAVGVLTEFVKVQDGQAVILGTDFADTIDVYSSVDVTGSLQITVNDGAPVTLPRSAVPGGVAVYARGGDDHVSIRSDIATVISVGAGNDTVIGGWGDDIIIGGPGDDVLLGREGNDLIKGNKGNDEIRGGSGINVLSGGPGTNIVIDDHQLVPITQVIAAQNLGPAPNGRVGTLTSVTASPNPVHNNGNVTLTGVGAGGNGGAIKRFEVWEFGAGGKLLGIDDTVGDGLKVEFAAVEFGGPGTHKTISRVLGTNGLYSNWAAKDIIVGAPLAQDPVVTDFDRTPNPIAQGQTTTFTAHIDDPGNLVNFVQFVWDRNGDDIVNTGDSILGNGSPLTNGESTLEVPITGTYTPGSQRFLVRVRYANNTKWTVPESRSLTVHAAADSAPGVSWLTPNAYTSPRLQNLVLTAHVTPGQFETTSVVFYRDANANGQLDFGIDPSIGTDSNGSDGWTRTVATGSLAQGQHTFFARGRWLRAYRFCHWHDDGDFDRSR